MFTKFVATLCSTETNFHHYNSLIMALAAIAGIASAAEAGISVVETVDGVYDLAKKIYTDGSALDGAKEFEDRYRSLELTIVNGTTHKLEFEEGGDYFDSGTWFTSFRPLVIESGQAALGFLANRQGSFLTGVTGGLRLNIEGTDLALFMGFTNPAIGSYKNSIHVWEASKEAKEAYECALDDSIKRHVENGYRLVALLAEPNEGGMKRMEFVITEA